MKSETKENINGLRFLLGLLISILVFMVGRIYFSHKKNLTVSKIEKQITTDLSLPGIEPSYGKKLQVNVDTDLKVSKLLSPTNSMPKNKKAALEFMSKMRKTDEVYRTFFDFTYDFFAEKPYAFAAARFVANSLLFSEDKEMFYLVPWTRKELAENSQDILNFLAERKNEITINPYFHSRMLNLVYQLSSSPAEKQSIYSEAIVRPIQFNAKGEISDDSRAIETALVLAKQSGVNAEQMKEAVFVSKLVNRKPKQLAALQSRVTAYYPELNYLF